MKLDGKQIVFSETIIAADEQKIEFEVSINDSKLPLAIIFQLEPEAKTGIRAALEAGQYSLIIRAINWNNSLGTASKEPIPLAEFRHHDGITIAAIKLLMAHHKIGETNVASVQILVEPIEKI